MSPSREASERFSDADVDGADLVVKSFFWNFGNQLADYIVDAGLTIILMARLDSPHLWPPTVLFAGRVPGLVGDHSRLFHRSPDLNRIFSDPPIYG
jgi:hypothetical protein